MIHARLPCSFCLIAASLMLLAPTAAQCGTATAKIVTAVRATDRAAVRMRTRTQQETSPETSRDTGRETMAWLIAVLLLSAGVAARRPILRKLMQRRGVPA